MGISLVQVGNASATSPPNQAHSVFTSATTPGNFLVALIIASGVTSSAPSGWSTAVTNNSNANTIALYYLANAPAQTIVASNLSGDATGWLCLTAEFSGVAPDSTLDVTSSSGTSNGTGSLTTTQSNFLIVGGVTSTNPLDYPYTQGAYPIAQRGVTNTAVGALLYSPTSSPGTYSDDTTPPGWGLQAVFKALPPNTVQILGVPSTTVLGTLSTSGPQPSITGVASTLSLGTLSIVDPATVVRLTGIASTTVLGSLTASGGGTVSLTGIGSTLSVGTLTAGTVTTYRRTITIPSGHVGSDLFDFLLSLRLFRSIRAYAGNVQARDLSGNVLPTYVVASEPDFLDVVVKVPLVSAGSDTSFVLEYW